MDDGLMSEGEVKEVQGQATSVYGNVAIMARCSRSTLKGTSSQWWMVDGAMRTKIAFV